MIRFRFTQSVFSLRPFSPGKVVYTGREDLKTTLVQMMMEVSVEALLAGEVAEDICTYFL